MQAILDDKELADRTKAEAKLKQRIEEMTAIAEAKGLNPEKYVDLLNEGRSALDVINILHADADELRQAQAEAERNTQNQSYTQNQAEFEPETNSEGKYAREQETDQKSQNMTSDNVAKKYGYRYQNMEIIFPERNMRQVKEQFKTLSQELGIIVRVMSGMESKAEKVEME